MHKRQGFTIVELLVVIVVIAVLAAITIVAFNGIQKRAQTSSVSSSLSNATKKIKLYQVDNGNYPSALADAGVTDGATTYQYSGTATTYCITGTQGSTSLFVSDTQSTPTAGGCAGHGQGGVSAITNIVINPMGTSYSSSTLFALNSTRWFGSGGSGVYSSSQTGATPVGSTYARKTWSVAPVSTSGDTGFDLTGYLSVSAGEVYTLSAYLRPSISKQAQVGLYRRDAVGTALSREYLYNQVIPANTWTRISATYTIPTGTATIHAVFDIGGSLSGGAAAWSVGDTLDITGMMITQDSTLHAYADGSSPSWVWNGAAHASTSTGPPV